MLNEDAYTAEELVKQGFTYPPPGEFRTFSSLYKTRSYADYSLTMQYINEGVYNAFLHREISKLLREQENTKKSVKK